jgi:hypothetical protein
VVARLFAGSGEADGWDDSILISDPVYRNHPAERLLDSMLEVARLTVGILISDPLESPSRVIARLSMLEVARLTVG